MTETWRDVVGYGGRYKVSDLGRVWSEPRMSEGSRRGRRHRAGRILKPAFDRAGYPRVDLSLSGQKKQHFVHLLVLEAFVGPRPTGLEACHGDGNSANAQLTNLRWDTHANNVRDVEVHGTNHNASKDACPRGHEYRSDNLRRATTRVCRACSKAHDRLCRSTQCDHDSRAFKAAADWYFAHPGERWSEH